MVAAPIPAATVVLSRPAEPGFEVLLLERTGRAGFMPNAWVFPGGRVDDQDALARHPDVIGVEQGAGRIEAPRERAAAMLVAAARETFEESGIWLGSGAPSAKLRRALCQGKVSFHALLEAGPWQLDIGRLHPWAWWITPASERRRYDTRFFLAGVDGEEAVPDGGELVAGGWFRPKAAIDAAERGELMLAPPTWWTLRELAAFEEWAEVLDEVPRRPQRPVQPMLVPGEDGVEVRLPGHPEHPEPPFPGLPSAVRQRGEGPQGRWWTID